jgi:hypothetical protein
MKTCTGATNPTATAVSRRLQGETISAEPAPSEVPIALQESARAALRSTTLTKDSINRLVNGTEPGYAAAQYPELVDAVAEIVRWRISTKAAELQLSETRVALIENEQPAAVVGTVVLWPLLLGSSTLKNEPGDPLPSAFGQASARDLRRWHPAIMLSDVLTQCRLTTPGCDRRLDFLLPDLMSHEAMRSIEENSASPVWAIGTPIFFLRHIERAAIDRVIGPLLLDLNPSAAPIPDQELDVKAAELLGEAAARQLLSVLRLIAESVDRPLVDAIVSTKRRLLQTGGSDVWHYRTPQLFGRSWPQGDVIVSLRDVRALHPHRERLIDAVARDDVDELARIAFDAPRLVKPASRSGSALIDARSVTGDESAWAAARSIADFVEEHGVESRPRALAITAVLAVQHGIDLTRPDALERILTAAMDEEVFVKAARHVTALRVADPDDAQAPWRRAMHAWEVRTREAEMRARIAAGTGASGVSTPVRTRARAAL